MRTLIPSIVLFGVLTTTLAFAQDEVPEEPVTLEEEPAEAPPAPETAEASETEASAAASVSADEATPPIVQMNASASAPPMPAAAGAAGGGGGERASNYGGPVSDAEDEWKFSYNGYFRAPLRFGLGERVDPFNDQSKTTIEHVRVPDNQYQHWQYTKANQGPWAELFFGMGNSWAKGTVAIQAFNFTDSSFNDRDDQGAQVGISQAWVTLNPQTNDIVNGSNVWLKVGSHWNRYGQAGKYDAGAYDTFAFGRTHVAGYTIHGDVDVDQHNFWVEQGFGGKQPDPSPFTNTKFTLLNHLHAGWIYEGWLKLGAHYLTSFTQEPDHLCVEAVTDPMDPNFAFNEAPVGACPHLSNPALIDMGDGSLDIYGVEARFEMDAYGDLYLAYSRIDATDAATVSNAVEVVHAPGGGFFNSGVVGQYLNAQGVKGPGNGSMNNFIWQYDVSLSSLIGPDLFGQSSLNASIFGMFNQVDSDDNDDMDINKLKWGTDIVYGALPWFAVGVRYDDVKPNNTISQQDFKVLSPRLIFRSDWATHEEITIGYARYFYAERECQSIGDTLCVQRPNGVVYPDGLGAHSGVATASQPPTSRGAPNDIKDGDPTDPNDGTYFFTPHEHTFRIAATIWW